MLILLTRLSKIKIAKKKKRKEIRPTFLMVGILLVVILVGSVIINIINEDLILKK